MDVKVERVIDGDSNVLITPDGERIRDRSNGTASLESTTTTGKQSRKGINQTARVKTYIRQGDTLNIEDNADTGVFGRVLVSPKKIFNGKEVDLNFLKTALGDNQYYTKYGVSKDNHENLKTGYNTWLPYQFKDEEAPLTEEEFAYIDEKLPEIQHYIERMKGGDNSEQQLFLDTLIGNVFGDDGSDKVAAYLDIKKRKEKMMNRENQPLSADKIMYDAFKDPRLQEEWDRSVIARQGSDDVRLAYKGKHQPWQEKIGAAFQLFNDMSNYADRAQLFMAQHSHLKITDRLLQDVMTDIPEEFRGIVTDEARKFGNERAYVKAQQLSEDIKSQAIFDDLNIAEQFVYGAGAYVTSLGSVVVGAKGFTLAGKATRVIRAWESNSAIKALATSGVWTAAAGVDAVAMEGPRLLGDATYTPEEMVVDVALDTALGAALPLLFIGASKVVKPHIKKYMAEDALNKMRNTKYVKEDLLNDINKSDKTYNKQFEEGIRSWEKTRGSNTKGEKVDVINGQEANPSAEGNTHATGSIDGDSYKPHDSSVGEVTVKDRVAKKSQEAAEDVIDGGWLDSGLDAIHTKAKKDIGVLGKVGQSLANLTGRAMSHRLQKSENAVMRFVGHVIVEDPSGYGGNMRRHSTAAPSAVLERDVGLSMILPNYARHIEEWSTRKGAAFHETFRAKWGTPDGNKLAKQFEREFIEAINARKMGRVRIVDKSIVKMLDSWKGFTDHMGNKALTEGLPGWSKLRENYFPQIRNNQKMANYIEKSGSKTQLERLFEKGMLNTREAGLHDLDDSAIRDLAKKIMKQAETGEKDLPSSSSGKLGRAQHRVEMDWSVTEGDLTLMDFLHTDIASTAERYASDLGGRLGIHKVTGGKLATDADIKGLRDVAYARHTERMDTLIKDGKHSEAVKLDKDFNKEMQMFDDTFNMVLGRPPRGGLAPELRHLKTFTTLTRMGVLGTSQSIETGNIIARSTVDLFSDPEVLKHMLSMNPKTTEGRKLLDDVMNITGRTKDMEFLHRPQQVLDEESLSSYSGLRQMSIMLADKATWGNLKQPASRLLGKTSMFNWVQRHQSEFVQKSFLIHTDRYFTTGKSSINPKRMIDLGLIDLNGNNSVLSHVFNNVVKKDKNGFIVDLQWNNWSKEAKVQYMDAAQRDEAQRLQQTFAGEAPAYYNKPLMNLLFQFREVPLVAQNKQLARNLMFGDVEAASSVMLNFAIAGMVRFGWLAGLGYAKAVAEDDTDNYKLPDLDRLNVHKYLAAGGLFTDAVEMMGSVVSGVIQGSEQDTLADKMIAGSSPILRQLPSLGVIKDAKDFVLGDNETNKRAEALQGLTLLGNTAWMDVIHTMFVKNINEMATHREYEEGEQ